MVFGSEGSGISSGSSVEGGVSVLDRSMPCFSSLRNVYLPCVLKSAGARPVDRFVLGFEGAENMVCMDIILDRAAISAAFGARFHVNVRHDSLLLTYDG
jgi:hypothetical protein